MTLCMKKLEWYGCPIVKKFEDMFFRFERVHKCDRWTDGRTLARLHRPRLHSIVWQKCSEQQTVNYNVSHKNETRVTLIIL